MCCDNIYKMTTQSLVAPQFLKERLRVWALCCTHTGLVPFLEYLSSSNDLAVYILLRKFK